jgi:hypothetical protein
MSVNFKPKNAKKFKYDKKSQTTLDSKHEEILTEINYDIENVIPKLKCERAMLKKTLTSKNISLETKLDYEDKLTEINKRIKDINERKKKYYLENSKYIFEYFENKKNISEGISVTSNQSNKNSLLNSFFRIKSADPPIDEHSKGEPISASRASFVKNDTNIVRKYLRNVDEDFLDVNLFVYPTDICQFCYKGELVPLEDEGMLICNQCSKFIPYLIENEKPSYKEPPKEVCFYAYKRINHFKEILAQFQGKETTQIPQEVIDNIKIQIKKERITLEQITNSKTKEILKKLGYNKYYEHIPFIKDKLGIKPPVMSPELEETLCNLFIELQAPYSKCCPNDRVNFLNYYYTAYKLCELLGETAYLKGFPMLKDPEKKMEQDVIWKQICEELDWEFIPTI